MSDMLEQDLRDIYAEDAQRYETTGAEARLSAINFGQRASHRRKVGMLGGGVSVALAAGIAAVVVFVASGGSASLPPLKGTSYSLAGWESVPSRNTFVLF